MSKEKEKILSSGLTQKEENQLAGFEKLREKKNKITRTEQQRRRAEKRRGFAQEARERLDILIEMIKKGDFDYKIYKRFDRDADAEAEYQETGEYPEDSDGFQDVLEWFDENIVGLIAKSNENDILDVREIEERIEATKQQYIEKIEKTFTERETDVYDEIMEIIEKKREKAEEESKVEMSKAEAEMSEAKKMRVKIETFIKKIKNTDLDKKFELKHINGVFERIKQRIKHLIDPKELDTVYERMVNALKERQAVQEYESKRVEREDKRSVFSISPEELKPTEQSEVKGNTKTLIELFERMGL